MCNCTNPANCEHTKPLDIVRTKLATENEIKKAEEKLIAPLDIQWIGSTLVALDHMSFYSILPRDGMMSSRPPEIHYREVKHLPAFTADQHERLAKELNAVIRPILDRYAQELRSKLHSSLLLGTGS